MIIYGVAFLAICTLMGVLAGELLGRLLGIPANVGGVGIAMLLLIGFSSYPGRRTSFNLESAHGIKFWAAIYVPIVVALAAQQNVYGALKGGPMAFLAGLAAVVAGFLLVPVLSRLGRPSAEHSSSRMKQE